MDYPWYYLLACFLLGGLYAGILYFKNKRHNEFSKSLLNGLTLLRFLAVSGISVLLLPIFVRRFINETEAPIVIIARDNSASVISGKDSATIKPKLNALYNQLAQKLTEKYSVKNLNFGSTVNLADSCDFTSKETDLANLFTEIDNNYANQNIGAVIIASDGIYNKGANPVFQATKSSYPIYTIALGDTTIVKDAAIQKVNHNQVAYLGNKFPVEVVVSATKLKSKNLKVSLQQNGVTKAEQPILINSDSYNQTVSFLLEADKPGVQRYTALVSLSDDESNRVNNYQTFVVEVIDNREKILLVANAPHPDVTAIKESIEASKTYEVEMALTTGLDKPVKPYSLVILQGYTTANQTLLNACKAANVPCWVVNPQVYEGLQGIKVSNTYNKVNDAEPGLNKTFGLFTISKELQEALNEWPAVKVPFGNYQLANGNVVLLTQKVGVVETDNPILSFQESNTLKTAVFIGDGLWRWKLRDFSDHENFNRFNELIGKTIQYLSVKADKSFFRVTSKNTVNENESVAFSAEVYNKSYEAITDPEVSLKLMNEANQSFNYVFNKTPSGYRLNTGLLPPGNYRYEAKTNVNGTPFFKQGVITVKAIEAEQVNTVANHQVLFQLSQQTGGTLFYPTQIEQLEKTILGNELIKPITYSSRQTTDIIQFKWLFALLLLLLATEWFLRKRNGTI